MIKAFFSVILYANYKQQIRLSVRPYLFLFVLLSALFTQSKAQIYDYSALQGVGDNHTEYQFRIYVPDTVSYIRGVYFYLHGAGGDSRTIVNDAQLTKLCEEERFALVGIRFRSGGDRYYYHVGLLKTALKAFKYFAQQSNHPEIEFAPIFLDGYSLGASFTYASTWWKPEIIIGFIAQKGNAPHFDMDATIGVPGYMIFGELDTPNMTPSFERHRPRGALWSLAMELGGVHTRITDRDLLDNYFRDVIELRLPAETIPGQPVVLNTIDESIGWLGDRSTSEIAQYDSFPGDKSQASWFPSEEVALRWQNFVLFGGASKIQESHSSNKEHTDLIPQQLDSYLNDSNPFDPPVIKFEKSNVQFNSGIPLSVADASFIGEAAGDWSGTSVSSAGDVNGDGFDDFIIGSPGKDGSFPLTNAGKTYLFLGRTAGDWGMDFNLSQADASFFGEASLDQSGFSVASAGDVNGDSLDDFLIGSFNGEGGNKAGQSYLILGRSVADWGMDFDLSQSDASFIGKAAGDWSGTSVSSAGDVNGDGLDDFLIGANGVEGDTVSAVDPIFETGVGETYLLLGRATADWGMDFNLAQADASFLGETEGDRSGYSISSAGDVNGDGMDDFLIGAIYNSHFNQEWEPETGGQTYLLLGKASADWGQNFSLSQADASFLGEGRFDFSGHSVTSAGDVNGDGFSDFLIGAYDNSDGGYSSGQTYLILGKEITDYWGMSFSLFQSDASFIGKTGFGASGFAIAPAGDVNGDNFDDFLIGAPNYGMSEVLAGESYIIYGSNTANWGKDFNLSEADISYTGEAVQDLSGFSVAPAGDVNGDGRDDILIGGWRNDEGGVDAGQTYLLLGVVTGIADERPIPTEFTLSQNYPNPFNPTTRIKYQIPDAGLVSLQVYNLLGEVVATLVNEEKPIGSYEVKFSSTGLSSGIYFYRLQAGDFNETKKMILLR